MLQKIRLINKIITLSLTLITLNAFAQGPAQRVDVNSPSYYTPPNTYSNTYSPAYRDESPTYSNRQNLYSPYSVSSAYYGTQKVPSVMRTNVMYDVSVTFTNNGSSVWIPGIFKLQSVSSENNYKNNTWSAGTTVDLSTTVYPGSSHTFTFRLTAPSTPGVYPFQWQLSRNGELFGETSSGVYVTVER